MTIRGPCVSATSLRAVKASLAPPPRPDCHHGSGAGLQVLRPPISLPSVGGADNSGPPTHLPIPPPSSPCLWPRPGSPLCTLADPERTKIQTDKTKCTHTSDRSLVIGRRQRASTPRPPPGAAASRAVVFQLLQCSRLRCAG